jgi:hypothetical protein
MRASGPIDERYFIELLALVVVAGLTAIGAFVHGDVFFGVFFGATTGVVSTHAIRWSVDM